MMNGCRDGTVTLRCGALSRRRRGCNAERTPHLTSVICFITGYYSMTDRIFQSFDSGQAFRIESDANKERPLVLLSHFDIEKRGLA
jgi:hypothetical protein